MSESLLHTARGLFAPPIGRKHVFQEVLRPENKRMKLNGVDLAFCDIARYAFGELRTEGSLLAHPADCLEYLVTAVELP